MRENLSRRDFMKGISAIAAGAALTPLLKVSASAEEAPVQAPYPEYDICGRLSMSELNASAVECETITKYDEEESYDIVVVGAGVSGMPAAIAAYEAGASVCVLQKLPYAMGQGTAGFAVDMDRTDELGVVALAGYLRNLCGLRSDYKQNLRWAQNCTEAMQWFGEKTVEAGLEEGKDFIVKPEGDFVFDDCECHGKLYLYMTNGGYTNAIMTLAEHFKEKFPIYLETPAVQLITDGDKVTGVYAKRKDGSILRLNASKGVILAAGDYQNNPAMVEKYVPDASGFEKKQAQRTGDAHLMAMLVGAKMQNIGHCKMIHTKNWGENTTQMKSAPFMAVNAEGHRFAMENIPYDLRNNEVKDQPGQAWIAIFDGKYQEDFADSGVSAPEKFVGTSGVYQADSIKELAEQLGMDADELQKSIDRYNELCALGTDLDYAKPARYMKTVEQAPFYALHYEYAVSALTDGLVINENAQVINNDGQVIPGLYAVGNCSGPFYATSDYPLEIPGGSVSRAITYGYLTGKALAEE